ncbi:hypothetical protein PPL_08902 [Heterostelium album PN500]|uniref:Uncharacterized protein n=1 Tax=Heterostelium pallidum (strain ATCC 26659 / Pp 5 / PN500) TaxID=670386 RepID=D3BK21_HETP5|nr:hypothetical protein PPL_08902 [Heterostelium album PN500]EFA78251.1 hypothetical protein PPL_08902 [Heterostelium album PN500]|eukprot:XP_020430376.1 hypothetical protein PPL_08902 [Heterostelium album PN500]
MIIRVCLIYQDLFGDHYPAVQEASEGIRGGDGEGEPLTKQLHYVQEGPHVEISNGIFIDYFDRLVAEDQEEELVMGDLDSQDRNWQNGLIMDLLLPPDQASGDCQWNHLQVDWIENQQVRDWCVNGVTLNIINNNNNSNIKVIPEKSNSPATFKHKNFMSSLISKLVDSKVISIVNRCPLAVEPLHMNGVTLSMINSSGSKVIQKKSFKCSCISTVSSLQLIMSEEVAKSFVFKESRDDQLYSALIEIIYKSCIIHMLFTELALVIKTYIVIMLDNVIIISDINKVNVISLLVSSTSSIVYLS